MNAKKVKKVVNDHTPEILLGLFGIGCAVIGGTIGYSICNRGWKKAVPRIIEFCGAEGMRSTIDTLTDHSNGDAVVLKALDTLNTLEVADRFYSCNNIQKALDLCHV